MRPSPTAVAMTLAPFGSSAITSCRRRGAFPDAENAIADDAEHGGDRDQGGHTGDQHQPAHFGDDARGLGIEWLFVVRQDAIDLMQDAAAKPSRRRRGGRRAARPRACRAHSGAVALAAQGADPRRRRSRSTARTIRDPRPSRQRRRQRHGRRCRRRSRPSPRARAIPLNIVYEDDELIVIDKPAGLVVHPARRPRQRHAGQRADRALRRQPVRHRRGEAAGHRAPARQGHQRPDGGGQDRRARTARSARSSPTRPTGRSSAATSLWSGARPARPRGTIDAPLDRHPHARDKRPCARAAASHDALASAGALRRRRTASRSRACSPARWRPAAPTRSGCIWPISAIRSWATRPTAPASRPRPACFPGGARRAGSARPPGAACLSTCALSIPISGEVLEFRSELPADLRRLRDALSRRLHFRPQPEPHLIDIKTAENEKPGSNRNAGRFRR